MSNVTDAHLNHIYEQITEVCENTLKNQVATKIIEIQKNKINEYVYKVYPEPEQYIRRKSERGGLLWGATSRVNKTKSHEAEISVYNKARGFRKDLPMLIEYGHKKSGYSYNFPRKGRAYMQARPFMQETFNELLNKNIVERLLAKELRKSFVKVRMV